MELILHFLHYAAAFLVILTAIVFVHEFGHYIVARWCGVRIETFSIGFGKEIFGWNDRRGTRWKISLLPLGGYVKMFGDASAASTPDIQSLEKMTAEEKAVSFHYKSLPRKAAIVAAGPLANFLLTIAILTYFIMTAGLASTEPVVGDIIPNTPAQTAGLKKGDRVLQVNDTKVETFGDIPYLIATNLGTPVTLTLERQGKVFHVILTPKQFEDTDALGNKAKRPLIGFKSIEIKYEDVGLFRAVGEAVKHTYGICATTMKAVGQMIAGKRDASELKGPLGIAKLSGQAAEKGLGTILWFMAMLSANLALVNLFPIPMLDGGHLLYYAVEAVRGRPMAERVQEYGFRLGFLLVFSLMAFAVVNDIRQLF